MGKAQVQCTVPHGRILEFRGGGKPGFFPSSPFLYKKMKSERKKEI
jgi:hypothetical protein